MGYWRTLHLFDDRKFYTETVPALKGETGDLTDDCREFLKSHVLGGTLHLSKQELEKLVNKTVEKIISISNSLDKTFKVSSPHQKVANTNDEMAFLNNLEGYYDFTRFFEYYIFKTCADFSPHLALGKGGVLRNFEISSKTLSCSIIEELDDWNNFFCFHGMGITNWISHEDLQYLYLDKENLKHDGNEKAKAYLTLLEIANANELGFIMGVDMREEILQLLPDHKTVKPGTWNPQNLSGLIWKI